MTFLTEGYGHSQWTGRTGGTGWMQKSLIRILRICPLTVVYALMAPVIPFYMLFDRRGYSASYSFFRTKVHRGPVKSFLSVYANEFRLGQMVIDRFAAFAGKRFVVKVDGQELFDELSESEKGFLQLSAHVGNYELAGYMLHAKAKSIYSLVFSGEKETVMKNRSIAFEQKNVVMVPVSGDMSHIFTLNSALDNGNIVSMPGDRIFGSAKSVKCTFMGEEASFPQGPFALAVQKDIPVATCFVIKCSTKSYQLSFRILDISHSAATTKADRVEAYANEFAASLEDTVKTNPTQWFNFFDFWK